MSHTVCNIVTQICRQKHTHTLICNPKLGPVINKVLNLETILSTWMDECDVCEKIVRSQMETPQEEEVCLLKEGRFFT